MDIPNNHHGIFLPDKKNSVVLVPAFLETNIPIIKVNAKNKIIIPQSKLESVIANKFESSMYKKRA
tara:strand:- start:304 stop:501 length:198 start_codon:yes stop_codon:yes gene_type:complete